MRSCERCGNEVSWTNDTIVLPGNIYAHVCHPCHRAFILMFKQSVLADRSADLEAREKHYVDKAIATQPVGESVRRALLREQQDLSLELAEASIAWLAQRVEAARATQ